MTRARHLRLEHPNASTPSRAHRSRWPRESRSAGAHVAESVAGTGPVARYELATGQRCRTLLASQDRGTAASLAGSLAAVGFTVSVAYDLDSVAPLVSSNDAIVADLTSLTEDRWVDHPLLRAPQRRSALIALTEDHHSESGTIAVGFDDAVAQPWSVPVIAARLLNAVRARAGTPLTPQPADAQLTLDEAARSVAYAGHHANLSPMEWEIFALLVAQPGTVVTRADLTRRLYGDGAVPTSRAVDVRVFHLRRKLGPVLANAIQTLPGVGWRLVGVG